MPNTPEETRNPNAAQDAQTADAPAGGPGSAGPAPTESTPAESAPHGRKRLKATVIGIAIAVAAIGCIVGAIMVDRALQAKSDLTGMSAPVYFASDGQTGRFTVNIEFTAPRDWPEDGEPAKGEPGEEGAADGSADEPAGSDAAGEPDGEPATEPAEPSGAHGATPGAEPETETVSIEMTWDDAWFFGNSSKRNDQLAFACKAISAAAEAQSATQAGADETAAFMEHVFATLGFSKAETVLDEEGAGYTIATKTIMSDSGEEKLVVAVCVHGQKLPVRNPDAPLLGSGFAGLTAENGHAAMAQSIAEAVKHRIGVRSSSQVALLFCGQGIGGNAAQDAADAVRKISGKGSPLAPAESVFVYASESAEKSPAEKADEREKGAPATSPEDPATEKATETPEAADDAAGN